MKMLRVLGVSGVLLWGAGIARAETGPSPETNGAVTTPSGAETPPPATYDNGTPATAPTAAPARRRRLPSGTAQDMALPPPPSPPGSLATVPMQSPNQEVVPVVPVVPVQPVVDNRDVGYHEPGVVSRVGVGLLLGGGYTQFTNSGIRNTTGDGGYWNVRIVEGTRQYVGFEAAYVGDARGMTGLGFSNNSRLISNGVEGVLRLNVPIVRGASLVEPFGFVGVGWQHYQITNNNERAGGRHVQGRHPDAAVRWRSGVRVARVHGGRAVHVPRDVLQQPAGPAGRRPQQLERRRSGRLRVLSDSKRQYLQSSRPFRRRREGRFAFAMVAPHVDSPGPGRPRRPERGRDADRQGSRLRNDGPGGRARARHLRRATRTSSAAPGAAPSSRRTRGPICGRRRRATAQPRAGVPGGRGRRVDLPDAPGGDPGSAGRLPAVRDGAGAAAPDGGRRRAQPRAGRHDPAVLDRRRALGAVDGRRDAFAGRRRTVGGVRAGDAGRRAGAAIRFSRAPSLRSQTGTRTCSR